MAEQFVVAAVGVTLSMAGLAAVSKFLNKWADGYVKHHGSHS